MQLRSPALLDPRAVVGERRLDSGSHGSTAITDPATSETLATVPRCGAEEARHAIDAAEQALPALRALGGNERAARLLRLASAVHAHRDDLARILTHEQGKPFAEAKSEIDYGASYFAYYGTLASALDGQWCAAAAPGQRAFIQYEPVGIGVAITPWNFPMAMVARKLAPAFLGGNPVILKPAEKTPLTALALAHVAREAGVPEGALSVLTGAREDAATIGDALLSDARVRKLSFTGSTEIGKRLYAACAPTVKRVSLELGGNAPFLVFDDADLDAAIEGLLVAKFRNAGQACIAANRILVQQGIHDRFVDRLAAAVASLRVGAGFEEGVHIGPLVDARALAKVERHVDDARARGGSVVVGGRRHARGGLFYEPTLIRGLGDEAAIHCEETFGPVAAVTSFATEGEAIARANATPYGLAAYLFTRDPGRIHRVSDALETGMVAVNVGMLSSAWAPFGGVKESGIGREGGREGLSDWLATKYVRLGGIAP